MRAWQRLLIIAPLGLLLGMAGGQLARPVMAERAGADTAQAMFQTRADRHGDQAGYSEPVQAPMTYAGGYSYVPNYADWSPPPDAAWTYADSAPLPTLAELDARQAALLADPEQQYAVTQSSGQDELLAPASENSEAPGSTLALARTQDDTGSEPHTADGARAIW